MAVETWSIQRPAATPDPAEPMVELLCAADIQCVPIRWLWPGWMARGKLHILAGSPGTGKTTIAGCCAAVVSRGGQWPDGTRAPLGNVLIWSGEDDPADTIVPRLRVAGADLSRIFIIGSTRDANGERQPFDPATDIPALEYEAQRMGGVSLLIADPVVSAVTGDSHKNTEVRRALQPMVNLAARLGAAILGITHFSKGSGGREPLERVTGSIAFGALARIVMVTAKQAIDGDENPKRLLARAKSNIGPDGGGFAYQLEQVDIEGMTASKVQWGGTLQGTARQLLNVAETDEEDDGELSAQDEAREWLRGELSEGDRGATELKAEANRAGIAWRTIERAKAELRVRSVKLAAGWRWKLPDDQPRQDRQETQRGNLDGVDGLGSDRTTRDGGEVIEL